LRSCARRSASRQQAALECRAFLDSNESCIDDNQGKIYWQDGTGVERLGEKSMLNIWRAACLAFGCLFAMQAVDAQTASDFYKGKSLTIVVGFGPGGGYDLYARLLANFMGRYIPGEPSFIVQNMPGAGSVRAANYVFKSAPKDGTVIAAVVQDTPMFYLLGNKGVEYDATKFNWLGGVVASNSLLYTWHATGIRTWQDAKRQEVILATTGLTAGSSMVPRTMNALMGTKFKLVPGYSGTKAIHLALERGEMMGAGGSTWAGLRTTDPQWIAQHFLNFLVQTGPAKEPELPDVPLLKELPATAEAKQIAAVVSLPSGIGYAHWLAPGVPAERVAILRHAYAAVMQDKDFLAAAAKQRLLIRPKSAEEITALIAHAAATPKSVLNRTAKILGLQ
jgi:tripartite-type tricarboxylate transporter receptor subunit TctC